MIKLNNLAGTIMLGNTPLVKFEFYKDRLLRCFFDSRITPNTRQGFQEYLEKNGMDYYDPETIIHFQNGMCIADKYWLKCQGFEGT